MQISLKAARINAGKSVGESAKIAGVTERTMNKWEKGETYPRIDHLFKLCDFYGVKLDALSFSTKGSV
jgi:transcriptional regulator with XRE-family HTH domain